MNAERDYVIKSITSRILRDIKRVEEINRQLAEIDEKEKKKEDIKIKQHNIGDVSV